MKRITSVVTLIMGLLLAGALPAAATSDDDANRAYFIGALGDAYVDLAGIAEADLKLLLGAVADPGWSDDDGDFDGDGDVDARDERVRRYAWLAYAAGLVKGTSDSTFDPHAALNRDQTATMFKRVFFGPEDGHRKTLYTDVPKSNVHSCNLHIISDIDLDGVYGDAPYIIQGYPPVPSVFKPNANVTERHVDLMVGRSVSHAASSSNPFEARSCGGESLDSLIEIGVLLDLGSRFEAAVDLDASFELDPLLEAELEAGLL